MAESLGIRLLAKIDTKKSIDQINNDLKTLEKSIQNLDLNIDVKGISKNLQQEMKKIKNTDIQIKADPSQIKEDFREVGQAIDKYEQEFESTTTSVTKNIDQQSGHIKGLVVTMRNAQNEIRKLHLSPAEDKNGNTVYTKSNADMQIVKNLESQNKQREQALRYEEQTRLAIEKTNQEEKEKEKTLNDQLDLYKRQAQINVQKLQRSHGSILSEEDNKRISDYLSNVNALSTATPNAGKKMKDLSLDFQDLNSQIKSSSSHVMTFGEQLKTAMARMDTSRMLVIA